ncbi:MAG: hypothetical protein C4519_11630 [Desulfobacteraceae bacterium]|nr:MAG: hypothetical protein C4519_11630 [Desulfobacteraceae bacterium]
MKPLPIMKAVGLAFVLLACACMAPSRSLLVGTPDDVIKQRAARMPAPLWQIPLGPALIEEMQLLGPDRLLVGMIKDYPGLPSLAYMLVDTARGEVLWRYPRNEAAGSYVLLLAFKDLLLFRIEKGKTTSLLALDPQTGSKLWAWPGEDGRAQYLPVPAAGRIVVAVAGENTMQIKALNLKDGAVLWEKSQPAAGAAAPVPIVDGQDILCFAGGIERLSSIDGHRVFLQPDLILDENCPPPRIDGDDLWLVDSAQRLVRMNAVGGSIYWAADLPASVIYTNIYPLDGKAYLRAIARSGASLLHLVRRDTGRIDWTYTGKEQSVSNLVEKNGLLYFGTPTSLVALDGRSGRQVFSSRATTTGRAFPVRIRSVSDRIVYIGELVVAAFDARTGALKYSHGMTPICPECHLNGLDAAVPRLKEELQAASGKPIGNLGELSRFTSAETVRYQNLANSYSAQARSAAGRGDYIGSDIASMKSSFARHESTLQANAAFAYAVVDLGLAVRRALETAAIRTSIERQALFRKSILRAYNHAESAEYVVRPHLDWIRAGESFTTLAVVHLPSGKRRDTCLSPEYLSYGLWNLMDFDSGIVYHHGIGMNPSRYVLSEARRLYPYESARTIQTFLIAVPIDLPR